jgi:hypothetical protein
MALRLTLLCLSFACTHLACPAQGAVSVGDATRAYELEQHAVAATALENDVLHLIESAPAEERFGLYRTFNQLVGSWSQVEFLQGELNLSIAAASPGDEDAIGTTLRDQAEFLLWELDHADSELERFSAEATRPDQLRANWAVRALLSKVRTTVSRLLADQCAHVSCTNAP